MDDSPVTVRVWGCEWAGRRSCLQIFRTPAKNDGFAKTRFGVFVTGCLASRVEVPGGGGRTGKYAKSCRGYFFMRTSVFF